jgi:hypothetical protein
MTTISTPDAMPTSNPKKMGNLHLIERGEFVPKNPLTALYLCHPYDVPYATFKRWKNEVFVTTPFVPDNKGDVIVKASHIFNAKRMYTKA